MNRFALLIVAVALSGCATFGSAPAKLDASPPPTPAVATDDQLAGLRRQAARAEVEITLLRRQLAALQVEVERLSASAEPESAVPRQLSPPAPLPSSPGQQIGAAFESSDLEPLRAAPVPTVIAIEPAPTAAAAPPAAQAQVAPPVAIGVPLAGQTIYDRGYTLYHQGRYLDAESSFQRFIQAHAGTELADNAQFWIGESRFARGDMMGALLAFQEVLDRYPGGNKVADSLLKAADCLMRLDNADAGIERYHEVVRRFPGSAAAAMAEERLSRPPG